MIFLEILKEVNTNYSQVLLLGIASLTLFLVYKEYVLKRRPFVMPEILLEKSEDKWFFNIVLVNKGSMPGISKITKAELMIGDETYPTVFKNEVVLAQGDRQKLMPIGHINENGIQKIIGHEYASNRVEIVLHVQSKSLGSKYFKYSTKVAYYVDVKGEKPIISLMTEELI